jgi:hypothetical protein
MVCHLEWIGGRQTHDRCRIPEGQIVPVFAGATRDVEKPASAGAGFPVKAASRVAALKNFQSPHGRAQVVSSTDRGVDRIVVRTLR